MKKIEKITIERKTVGEKYNPFQTGHGVWTSEKYKKKGRKAEKERKEMKDYL